jgi:hypothetical protein
MLNKYITSDKDSLTPSSSEIMKVRSEAEREVSGLGCHTKQSLEHLKERIQTLKEIKTTIVALSVGYGIKAKLSMDFGFKIEFSVPRIKTFLYSGDTDTLYIYGENRQFGNFVLKQMDNSFVSECFSTPCISKSIDFVDCDDVDEYALEFIFGDKEIIAKNNLYGLKTLRV